MECKIISFRFNVPFALALPESSFKATLENDQFCFIIVRGHKGKKEFSTEVALSENINWDSPDGTVAYITTKNASGVEMEALDVLCDKGGKTFRTRKDLNYTAVELILKVPDDKDVESYKETARDRALGVFSRFLLGYRLHASDHFVPDLSWVDIAVIEIRAGTGTQLDSDNYKFTISDANTPWYEHDDMRMHVKTPLTIDTVNAIAQWVTDGMNLEGYSHLLLISAERGIFHKDYIGSAILCQTAFEVFLSEFVRTRALQAGISQLPIMNNTLKPVVQTLEESAVKYTLKVLLKTVTGTSVAGGKEYRDWDSNSYTLRNEIVHSGRIDVTRADVKKAFDSVMALITKIRAIP